MMCGPQPRTHRDSSRARWRAMITLALLQGIAGTPLIAQQRIVLTGATLIDGNGGAPIPRSRIVLENGHFTCVSGEGGCPVGPGDRAIDLSGKWITPGLIDTHVHLPFALAPDGLWRLQRLRFALGITTVRDAGSLSTDTLLAARKTSEEGARAVPRLVVAARVVEEDAKRYGVPMGGPLATKLAQLGVDAIKIKEPFTNEDWRDDIRAARAAGIPVFGHTWEDVNHVFTREAVAAGISGVSHIMAVAPGSQPDGTVLSRPASEKDFWPWEKHLWLTTDQGKLDSLINEMVAANVWLEPTITLEYHFGRPLVPPVEAAFLGEPPTLRQLLRGAPRTNTIPAPAYPETWKKQSAFLGDFIKRGGMVVAGSDGKRPGIDLHEELRLIGEVAGSPMVGLQSATKNAAIALNRKDIGTIEEGKLADAVVYDADPLGPVGSTLRIERVIKGGTLYPADSLRAEFRKEYDDRVRELWRKRFMLALKTLVPLVLLTAILTLLLRRRRRPTKGALS